MNTENSIATPETLPSTLAECNTGTLKQVLLYAYKKFSVLEDLLHRYEVAKGIIEYTTYIWSMKSMFSKKTLADFGLTADDVYAFADKHNVKNFQRSLNKTFGGGSNAQQVNVTKAEKKLAEEDLAALDVAVDNIVVECSNDAVLQLIPPKYRYPLALKEMSDYAINMLADSWKECAKLYEEQVHRWTLEKNSEQALLLVAETNALAASASRNSTAAAIFSGINLFLR